jgi:PIN domain nuclease of toxin-antitoxin system
MSIYATDTHALIYFANQNYRRLSPRATDAFEQAERGEALIRVPAPALWEVSLPEKLGHVRLSKPYEEWAKELFRLPCFDCVALDAEIIAKSRTYTFNDDIFDTAIVATARLKDVPLITRDTAITDSGLVEILW